MGAVVTGCGGCEDSGVSMGVVSTVGVAATWLVETFGASAMSISGEDIPLLPALELFVAALKAAALGCDAIELASVLALKVHAVPQDAVELSKLFTVAEDDDEGDDAAEVGGLPNTPQLASNAANWSMVSYSHSISSLSSFINCSCSCSTKPYTMWHHVLFCRGKRMSNGICMRRG